MADQKVQRRTFYLLGCESCGKFESPPKPLRSETAAPSSEPMRCQDCGEVLLLVEGFVAPQAEMWQRTPGATWQHVAFPELLPDSDGRQLWMPR